MHPELLFVRKCVLSAIYIKTSPKKLQTQSTVVVDVSKIEQLPGSDPVKQTGPTTGDRMCWKCETVATGTPGVSAFCECGGWFE